MSLLHLKPLISEILQSPDTDLTSISAKRVRKALSEKLPDLDVKEHKAEIDAIIIEAFHELQSPDETTTSAAATPTAAPTTTNGDASTSLAVPVVVSTASRSLTPPEGPPPSSPGPSLLASRPVPVAATKTELTDEEYARMLHDELNTRTSRHPPRRGAAASQSRATHKAGGSRKTKSSHYVEDSDDDGIDTDTKEAGFNGAYKPAKRAKRERDPDAPRKGAFHKLYALSPELAAVVGAEQMSRPDTIKALWAYIRENNLQNPNDKRVILCDDRLLAIMNTKTTTAFKMNKPLQKHFYPLDPS